MKFLLGLVVAAACSAGMLAAGEFCSAAGQQTSGLNTVCYYQCPSGMAAMTIRSYQICPVSLSR